MPTTPEEEYIEILTEANIITHVFSGNTPYSRDYLIKLVFIIKKKYTKLIIEELKILHSENVLYPDSFQEIMMNSNYSEYFLTCFKALSKAGRLTKENCNRIFSKLQSYLDSSSTNISPQVLSEVLDVLANMGLLTQEEFYRICNQFSVPALIQLNEILKFLYKNNPRLLTVTNYNTENNRYSLVGFSADGLNRLREALVELHKLNLLNPENFSRLLPRNFSDFTMYAKYCAEVNYIITQNDFDTLMFDNVSPRFIYKADEALPLLKTAGLLNADTIKAIIDHPEHALELAKLIIFVNENLIRTWNQTIQVGISWMFNFFRRVNQNLLSTENISILINNAQSAVLLNTAFKHIASANILSQENFDKVIQHIGQLERLNPAFFQLTSGQKNYLTQENFERLISNPEDANSVSIDILHIGLDSQLERERERFVVVDEEKPHVPRPLYANKKALKAVDFPEDYIPEKYLCELLKTIMDTPVRLPVTNQICDFDSIASTLQRTENKNPYNRQPLTTNGLIEENELQTEISDYVSFVVDKVNKTKLELCRENLNDEDYKSISEQATHHVASKVNNPGLSR